MNLDKAIQQLYGQPADTMEIRDQTGTPIAYLVKPGALAQPIPGLPPAPSSRRPKLPLSKRQRASAKHDKLVAAGKRRARQDQSALA